MHDDWLSAGDVALAAEGDSLSGGDTALVAIVLVISLAALAFAAYLIKAVMAADQGTVKMREIAQAVQEGAAAYLRRQFRTLGVFAVIVFLLLLVLPVADGGWETRLGRAVFFLVGAVFSASVGFIGMTLATRANVRVAAAANAGGYLPSFRTAYRTGGVVGMITIGLGLFGAALVLLLFDETAPIVLEGFGFGGALLAMFMRVGGGIFTKAADVGADLVGKVEAGIPEDDPRNAATIADNVGDNVGDCAGMAADLFESYAVTLVAALILGQVFFGSVGMVFPLLVAAIGVIASVVGVLATRPAKTDSSGMAPINRGFFTSAAVSLVLVAAAAFTYLPSISDGVDMEVSPQVLGFVSVLIGVVLAAAIQQLTGYFTETSRKPVKDIGRSSLTGPATVILSGISLGLESAVYAAVLIGGAVYGAFLVGGGAALYAVALAGCGLLTTAGVIVAMDTFGPVSDNAQGIAEMSGDIDEEGARVLTDLDAVGNTTKAITKGIAIATAVLAATALFGSYNAQLQVALDDAGDTAGGDPAGGVQPGEPEQRRRGDPRRRGRLLLLRAGHQRGLAGGRARGVRGPGTVPHQARDHGLQREARLRRRRRHLHQGLAPRAGHPRPARRPRAGRGRLRARLRPARGVPRRRHRGRHADGRLPVQLRRRLGQREEDGRGRLLRRQGQRGARRHRHR